MKHSPIIPRIIAVRNIVFYRGKKTIKAKKLEYQNGIWYAETNPRDNNIEQAMTAAAKAAPLSPDLDLIQKQLDQKTI